MRRGLPGLWRISSAEAASRDDLIKKRIYMLVRLPGNPAFELNGDATAVACN